MGLGKEQSITSKKNWPDELCKGLTTGDNHSVDNKFVCVVAVERIILQIKATVTKFQEHSSLETRQQIQRQGKRGVEHTHTRTVKDSSKIMKSRLAEEEKRKKKRKAAGKAPTFMPWRTSRVDGGTKTRRGKGCAIPRHNWSILAARGRD